MLAKALFGAFLFLLVASYYVLPCMSAATASSDLFSSVGGPQSCQEHKIFKAQADASHLSNFLPAEPAFRFLVALPVVLAAGILAITLGNAETMRIRHRRWRRVGSLPFATSDPPKLPAFAAFRDA